MSGQNNKNMKKFNFLVILIIIVLAIIVGYNWIKSSGIKISLSESPTPTATPTPDELSSTENDQYSLAIEYPKIQSLQNSQTQKDVNAFIKTTISSIVEDFKTNVNENALKDFSEKSSLDITYKTIRLDNVVASFEIGTYEYVSGMAHPSTMYYGLNYDLINNKELKLSDLFNTNSDYLPIISTLSRQSLKTQLEKDGYYDESMLNEGTNSNNPENFSEFTISANGINFIFNTAQVAPYVAGTKWVEITFSQLSEFNNKNEFVTSLRAI